jgi:hypothetical protein
MGKLEGALDVCISEMRDISCMTTGKTPFGANQAAELKQQQMATSLDNLANVSIKKNATRTGYCWSHGFKVKAGHTSCMCTSHKVGHQSRATQTNC